MKILNLYFKNINSLEGESRIHFDRAPIVGCGVFAITGPNGSGKSSILDVITLGLYGETYRFDRPAEFVMTKSKAESLAEVEFEVGDNKYRSSWHVIRRNENSAADFLPPEMKLIQLNGSEQVIADGIQQVREKIVELTGMDFHSFTKSMVLPQGDFAAFLNALESERMDVLEKISGTDIYEGHRKEAKDNHLEATTQLQQLEQDLNAIPVLDPLAKEASEHDLADFKEQLAELDQEQNTVELQLNWLQSLSDLNNQSEALEKQHEQEKSELVENQKILEQIESTPSVSGIADEIVTLDSKTEETLQSKKALDSFRSELESLQNQLKTQNFDEKAPVSTKTPSQQKSSIDELKVKLIELNADLPREKENLQLLDQQIEEKKLTLSTINNWLIEHEKDKKLVESFPEIEKLKVPRVELTELSKKQKDYSKWSKNKTASIKKKKADTHTISQKITDSKNKVKENEDALGLISDGRSIEELHDLRTEQKQRVDDFTELLSLAGVNTKLGKKSFFGQLFVPKGADKEVTELTKEADHLQLVIGKEQNIVKTLKAAIKNELLLQKMQADREHLVDGKPCFLCGALNHPYKKHPPAVSNSKQVLAEQQKKIKRLKAEASSLTKQISAAEVQAVKDGKKDNQLTLVRSQWRSLANKLNSGSIDMDNLSLMKGLLKKEKLELSNITKILKNYSKQQNRVAKSKSSIEAHEVTFKRVSAEAEVLSTEWNDRPQESIEIDQIYAQSQAQEKTLSEQLVDQLKVFGEEIPAKGKEDALFETLNYRRKEYQNQLAHQQPLPDEIKALEAKLKDCESTIEKLDQETKQYTEAMQQEELVGLHLSLVEKQKLIAEKEVIFSQQEKEVSSLKQDVLEKSKTIFIESENTPTDLNTLKETVALVKRQPEVQQKQASLNESIGNFSNKIDAIQLQIETEKAKQLTTFSEQELLEQKKTLQEKLDITQQEVDSLQRKLVKQDDLHEKYQATLTNVENQKAIVEETEAEVKFVSDENALEFRHKVQQSLIDKLLSHANRVLEKISGRYYLRKVESEHGLALEIEDTKQKNVRRLPKTLSGGESFVVSLSLALGLADIASNGHAIDTLFLDEGFGNLDEESLYLVMTTLEGLKIQGKLVGVISHVEGVRKRIKTQIEMIKQPNGFSALKVTS